MPNLLFKPKVRCSIIIFMTHYICPECPNGCHLSVDIKSDKIVVNGNQCEKGAAYVSSLMEGVEVGNSTAASAGTALKPAPAQIFSRQETLVYSPTLLADIASFWGLTLKAVRPKISLDGSPERTLFRVVIEDTQDRLFVLEEIPPKVFELKARIIKTLNVLQQRQMPGIQPYLSHSRDEHILEANGHSWQMMPFVRGVALDREKYIYEKWRGLALSEFLIALREKTQDISFLEDQNVFSIKTYVYQLVEQIQRFKPRLMDDIGPIVHFLEKRFMRAHDHLPVCFCHGDCHPLNIIWGEDSIKAVIDWEFMGIKPEIYDVSNVIGCIGIEHPSSLAGEFVVTFIAKMKKSKLISQLSWDHLIEFIVAVRFAWLSEWLRKSDEEMLELEAVYMKLLIDNQKVLKEGWGI